MTRTESDPHQPGGTSHAEGPIDTGAWRRLLSGGVRDDARAATWAHGPLARWCEQNGVRAAFYTDGAESDWVRVACAPDEAALLFPETLDIAADPDGSAFARIALPGGVVLHDGTLPLAEDDPTLLLLATGARIAALEREVQTQSFQARFRGVELQSLYEVGLAITSTLDLDDLAEEVLLRAVSLLDARRGALFLREDADGEHTADRYRLVRTIGGAARDTIDADAARGLLESCTAESCVIGDGGGVLPEVRFLLAAPIAIDDRARGLLAVGDKESRRGVGPFPEEDQRTLGLFANQAAIAIENATLHRLALEKERLEREMELASEIQRQILPAAMPDLPGYDVLGWNRPARQVGGDYFDVHAREGGCWSLTVGDVTGKGLPAALTVSTLHSALQLLAEHMASGPAMIARLNRHVYESTSRNKFITLFHADLDPATGHVAYVNAGHNPGYRLAATAAAPEELPSGGLPIGLLPAASYSAGAIELAPGDLLCLYSDGITECADVDDNEFGEERLIELLIAQRDAPLDAIIRTIDEACTAFADGLPQGDDQTVLLLRRRAD
ncbi:MAG: SpoIIE family protein phosphatase [Acidobacteriota bacterium]